MTEIWLVRHGQTDWNLVGRWQGHADIPLNSTGLEQARILADKLVQARQVFTALYSSDLLRAFQTAQVLGDRLGLIPVKDRRLREISKGQWEGMLAGEARLRWNETSSNPLSARAPGGESILEVAERLARSADDISAAHPIGPVLIVTHGLALATLLCQARRLPLEQAEVNIPDNAVAQVIFWPPRGALEKGA
jgi:broad specificity phosphatase PhoE